MCLCLELVSGESYAQKDIVGVRKAEKELGAKFYNSDKKRVITAEVLVETTGFAGRKFKEVQKGLYNNLYTRYMD